MSAKLSYSEWLDLARQQQKRFWSKVNKSGPVARLEIGPCWLWTGGKDKDGYGKFAITGPAVNRHNIQKHVRAHRLSWEMTNGVVPNECVVRHLCDVRACVRLDHIMPGTVRENVDDRATRGHNPSGDQHWTSRRPELIRHGTASPRGVLFSEDAVLEIRRLYAGGVSIMDIWRKLNMPRNRYQCVWRVARGVTYPNNTSIEVSLTPAQWKTRLEEFNSACAYCLRTNTPLTKDHLIPSAKGGSNLLDNIVPACSSCNLRKGSGSMFAMLGTASTSK